MDQRRGVDASGGTPLKVAGMGLALLAVIAVAFGLGMRAGRELDFEPGKKVSLAPKSEGKEHSERHAKELGAATTPAQVAGTVIAAAHDGAKEPRSEKKAVPAVMEGSAAAEGNEGAGTKPNEYDIFRTLPKPAAAPSASAGPEKIDKQAGTVAPVGGSKPAATVAKSNVPPEKPAAAEKPPPKPKPNEPPNTTLTVLPEPVPAGAPKSTTPGYTVQVASSQDKADADRIVTRLKAKGFSGQVAKVQLPSGTWYRVRVGRYGSVSDAKVTQKKLTAAGFAKSVVSSDR